VDHWSESSDAASQNRELGDVQSASQVLATEVPRVLASPAADPARVKHVIVGMHRFLDRADQKSRGQAPVRKRIALVYRQVGDFEATVRTPQLANKRDAVGTFQRAAAVAASVGEVDEGWAREQLAQLDGRLNALGSRVDASLLAPPKEAPVALSAPPPPSRPVVHAPVPDAPLPPIAPAPVPERPTVDTARLAEIMQQLTITEAHAAQAHKNLETLRQRLAADGQMVNAATTASMARVDSFLRQAHAALGREDLDGAEEQRQKAEYELQKVFRAVGN
jgi:hypothetical protein